jgi:hypothetical protein
MIGDPQHVHAAARPSPSWGPTWIVIVLATIGIVVALVTTSNPPGGGSSGTANVFVTPSTSDFSTPTYDYGTTDTTPVVDGETPDSVTGTAATWTITGSDDQGYSAQVTIAADDPVKIGDVTASSGAPVASACSPDPETDALIPVSIEETNQSGSFSSILGFTLRSGSSGFGNEGVRLASDVSFTSGTECIDPSAAGDDKIYGVQWNDPIAPGAMASDTFYLVVYNYYSPANPSGDTASLQGLSLAPEIIFGDTHGVDARRVTNVSVDYTGAPPFTINGPGE